MKKILCLLLFAILWVGILPAQKLKEAQDTDKNILNAALKGWRMRISAGFNIGGCAPLPLPREIRSIDGYHPGLNFALEGDVDKSFGSSKKWGARVGLRLETKGMTTDATTKNYHMEAVNTDGSGKIVGAWTGKVNTKVRNTYLTIPILATYTFNDRWAVSVGPYFSRLFDGEFSGEAYEGYIRDQNPTGEKAEVTRATYDFSQDLCKFHWGIQVGGEFKAYKHLSVMANLQWGNNGIFPSDFQSVTFALYPIYATVGFAYLF